jgi:hypothetical protein
MDQDAGAVRAGRVPPGRNSNAQRARFAQIPKLEKNSIPWRHDHGTRTSPQSEGNSDAYTDRPLEDLLLRLSHRPDRETGKTPPSHASHRSQIVDAQGRRGTDPGAGTRPRGLRNSVRVPQTTRSPSANGCAPCTFPCAAPSGDRQRGAPTRITANFISTRFSDRCSSRTSPSSA